MTPQDELRKIKLAQIAQKREAAARARRLAGQFWSIEDRDRALQFADELEAQADELERGMAGDRPSAPTAQTQVQMQMQVQQGPPAKSEDDKK